MDWKDKMKKAMKAIKEACEENTTWIGEKKKIVVNVHFLFVIILLNLQD